MNTRTMLRAMLLTLLLGATGAQAACENPHPLRLALIPKSHSQQLLQSMAPLARVLEQALQRRVELSVAHSYAAVVEGLLAGTVDLAELGPASYAQMMQRGAVAAPVAALSARGAPPGAGIASYHSVLIVRTDARIDSPAALRGQRLSLTDPASTSGALLPRQALPRLSGTTLEQFFGQVSYAGSHDRAIAAVRQRRVEAAFVSSTRLDELLERDSAAAQEFKVLWRSAPLPTDPFVLRHALCPELRQRVLQVLLQSRQALEPVYEALGTGPFVAATEDDYRGMLALFERTPAR